MPILGDWGFVAVADFCMAEDGLETLLIDLNAEAGRDDKADGAEAVLTECWWFSSTTRRPLAAPTSSALFSALSVPVKLPPPTPLIP